MNHFTVSLGDEQMNLDTYLEQVKDHPVVKLGEPVGLHGDRPVFLRGTITEALNVAPPTFNRIRKSEEMDSVSCVSEDINVIWAPRVRQGQTLYYYEALKVAEELKGKPSAGKTLKPRSTVSRVISRPSTVPSLPVEPFQLKDFGQGHVGYYVPTSDIDLSDVEAVDFGFTKINKVKDEELTIFAKSIVPVMDHGYTLSQEQVLKMGAVIGLERHLWVYGPTGSGKSSMVARVCSELNYPVIRVNMSADTTISSFIGQWGTKVVDGVQHICFLEGPLLKAMMHGALLIIDEITATPAPILMGLQKLLEATVEGEGVTFVCNDNEGKIYHGHPRFRVVATDNTNGQGDVTGAYSGTNIMNSAFLDRFTVWSKLGYPEEDNWVEMLVKKTGVTEEQAKQIVQVCTDINRTSALIPENTVVTNGLLLSPRSSIELAKLSTVFGVQGAFKMNQLDRIVDDKDRQTLLDTLSARGVI